jgi:hypothetical protein
MGTVLFVLVILAAIVTIASGAWVAAGLISAVASFKPKPPVPPEPEQLDPS